MKLLFSDGSGTQKPENPTQPEGFLLTRTRPEPEKNIANLTRPKPEKLQTRPENPNMQKICIFIKIYIKFSLKKSNQNFFSKIFFIFRTYFLKKFFQFLNFEKN